MLYQSWKHQVLGHSQQHAAPTWGVGGPAYRCSASARFQDGDNQVATTFSIGLKVDGTGTGQQKCRGSVGAYPSMRLLVSISPIVYIQGPQEWLPVPFIALLDGRRPLMFQVNEMNCTPKVVPYALVMFELTGVLSIEVVSPAVVCHDRVHVVAGTMHTGGHYVVAGGDACNQHQNISAGIFRRFIVCAASHAWLVASCTSRWHRH